MTPAFWILEMSEISGTRVHRKLEFLEIFWNGYKKVLSEVPHRNAIPLLFLVSSSWKVKVERNLN